MTVAHALLMAGAGAAVTALAVSLFVLREAYLDLRAVKLSGLTNGRRLVAMRAFESEASRSTALVLFVVAAIGSFLSVPEEAGEPQALVIISLGAFAVAQVVLAVDAARGLKARRELLGGIAHTRDQEKG